MSQLSRTPLNQCCGNGRNGFNLLILRHAYTAMVGIFLRVSHSKLQYLGEVSLSFDVHYDSIFLHFAIHSVRELGSHVVTNIYLKNMHDHDRESTFRIECMRMG